MLSVQPFPADTHCPAARQHPARQLTQQHRIMASPKAAKAVAVLVSNSCKFATLITAMLEKTLKPMACQKGGGGCSSSSGGRSSTTSSSSSSKTSTKKETTSAKKGSTSSKGSGNSSSTACTCGEGNAGDACPACGPVVEPSELTSEGWPAWLWYKVQAQPWVAYTMLYHFLASISCRAESVLYR